MRSNRDATTIPLENAVVVVIIAGCFGGVVGYLCIVHLTEPVASELETVWMTTVASAVIALSLWGYRQP